MKVLEVGLSHNPGGVESFVMNYYRRLRGAEFTFQFLCMYEHLAYQQEILANGDQIHYLPDVKKKPQAFASQFRQLLEHGQYDVVHVNMLSAANILPLKISQQAGVAHVIAHSHNTNAPGVLRNLLHRWNRKKVIRCANHYWACSKDAADWLFSSHTQPDLRRPESVRIIKNAIETEKFLFSEVSRKQVREELGLQGQLAIGHVGRLETQKNHGFLLHIFREILSIQGDAQLYLVGDGPDREKLTEQAAKDGILEHVHFLGTRSDVPSLLSAFDVFLFPSLFEGLSVTAVEAQCAGLPCVVSEGLTEDTRITDNFWRVPLTEAPRVWAEMVLEKGQMLRTVQNNDMIRRNMEESGFSIGQEALRMRELLLSWRI